MKIGKPNRTILLVIFTALLVFALPVIASAQGRGRGVGRGLGRGGNQNWKCGVFVNCHDARDGRIDGRGPNRRTGFWRNGIFVPSGTNVRYRNGRSTNDYWRRRHVMDRNSDGNWRYRNRNWRNR